MNFKVGENDEHDVAAQRTWHSAGRRCLRTAVYAALQHRDRERFGTFVREANIRAD
jgi:hypothetical protein